VGQERGPVPPAGEWRVDKGNDESGGNGSFFFAVGNGSFEQARHFKLGFDRGGSADPEAGARRANLDGSDTTAEMRPHRGDFYDVVIGLPWLGSGLLLHGADAGDWTGRCARCLIPYCKSKTSDLTSRFQGANAVTK
jgi:hypothetical protein